jgi:hypothetical protein
LIVKLNCSTISFGFFLEKLTNLLLNEFTWLNFNTEPIWWTLHQRQNHIFFTIQVFPLIFNRFFLIFCVIIRFNEIFSTFFYMGFCSYCNQDRNTVSYEASNELFPQIFRETPHQRLIISKQLVVRRHPSGAPLTASRYMHQIFMNSRSFIFLWFCSSIFHYSRTTNRFPIEWVHAVEF